MVQSQAGVIRNSKSLLSLVWIVNFIPTEKGSANSERSANLWGSRRGAEEVYSGDNEVFEYL